MEIKLTEKDDDYLILTEIMNDLHKTHGTVSDKAYTQLKDWKEDLRSRISFPKTKQKVIHAKTYGGYNW